VLSWMAHRRLAGAFDCYAGAVEMLVAQRKTLARMVAVWRATGLKKAWEAWTEYLEIMHGERAQELAKQQLEAAARETQQLKDEADRQQAKALEEARRRIETCRRVVQRMVREHLARAWACFTESIWSSKRNHETLRRVLKRTSHRLLAVAFEGYSKAVSTENSRRKKVTKVVGRWTLPGLIKALEAWVEYVEITRQERGWTTSTSIVRRMIADIECRSNARTPSLSNLGTTGIRASFGVEENLVSSGVSLPVTPGKPRFETFNRANLYRKNQQQESHQTVDTGVPSTTNAIFSSSIPPAVQLLSLDMDFSQAGEEGSEEREQFKNDVTADLASASGAPPASFFIKKMSAGSVKVDMEIVAHPALTRTPEDMALDMEKQASDSNSLFRPGKLAKHSTSIIHPVISSQPLPKPQVAHSHPECELAAPIQESALHTECPRKIKEIQTDLFKLIVGLIQNQGNHCPGRGFRGQLALRASDSPRGPRPGA